MKLLRRVYYVTAYYVSWLVFGSVGLLLNLGCIPLLLLPHRERYGASVRRVIRASFDLWLRWLHFSRVVRISWEGFDEPLQSGTVFVANHPTLVDATFLLARLPDAICIFKPRLMRNPAIGPAALMGGYISGDAGIDLIRQAAEKVAGGNSLLIFPEGTRTTPGRDCEPLKAGFALIAQRAHAPIQLIKVIAPPDLAARGRPWWKPPEKLPAYVHFRLDRRWNHDPHCHAAVIKDEVENRLREPVPA